MVSMVRSRITWLFNSYLCFFYILDNFLGWLTNEVNHINIYFFSPLFISFLYETLCIFSLTRKVIFKPCVSKEFHIRCNNDTSLIFSFFLCFWNAYSKLRGMRMYYCVSKLFFWTESGVPNIYFVNENFWLLARKINVWRLSNC